MFPYDSLNELRYQICSFQEIYHLVTSCLNMDKKSVITFLAIFNGCHMTWLLHASTHTKLDYLLETCKRKRQSKFEYG